MGRVVLVKDFSVSDEIRFTPTCEVQPRLRVERVPISGIPMLINAGGNASVLERLSGHEAIEDDTILISSFLKFCDDLPGICPFIHVELNFSLNRLQPLSGVIQVIPR